MTNGTYGSSAPEPDGDEPDDGASTWAPAPTPAPIPDTSALARELQRDFSDLLGAFRTRQRRDAARGKLTQLAPGSTCPRCVERGNPRPGRLARNADDDLSCFICGHVEYGRHPRAARKLDTPDWK